MRATGASCSPKIARPATPGVVIRERLFARIDQAGAPVAWICGAPGSGKTTLASSYVEARQLSGIWYQLDASDRDPASFLQLLEVAARRSPLKPRRLPTLPSEASPDLTAFAKAYFRALFSGLPASTALVFDNFQEAECTELDTLLHGAFAEVPDGARVIVASRVEPPASLARLIANRRIAVIDGRELQLTRDESDRIALNQADIGDDALASLHVVSGGWAAGVVLIAEHLRRSGPRLLAELDGSRKSVFDYFASEVLARANAEDQRLLMLTADLPSFGAEVAEAVSGHRDAAACLESLHRRNLFVDRHEGTAPVYQYHPLFRAFLRARAEHDISREVRSLAVCTAARLAEAGPCPDDAVPLYLEARDWTSAVRLILQQAPSLYERGRWRTLLDWIDTIPADASDLAPWLAYWGGACLVWHDPPNARHRLEAAHARFTSTGDRPGQVLCASVLIRACILGGDWARLDRWISALESLLEGESDDLPQHVALIGLSRLLYASYVRRPESPVLAGWADRTLAALLASAGDCNQTVLAGFSLMNYYNWTGNTASQTLVVRHVEPLLSDVRLSPVSLAYWMWGHAGFALRCGALSQARALIDESLELARASGLAVASVIRRHRIGYLLTAGDLAGAEAELKALESESRLEPYFETKAWLALLRGDIDEALNEAETALRLAIERGRAYYRIFDLVLLARICAEAGALERARRYVREYREGTAHLDGRLAEYHALLVESYIALQEGDRAACHARLRAALAIAAHQRYLSHWGWSPKMMSRLYAEAFKGGIALGHVQDAVLRHDLRPESPDVDGWPWPVRVYTMGSFEIVAEGKPVRFEGKPQHKPIELLKVLIAAGERGHPAAKLIDLLWRDHPDGDGQKSVEITIHRLRKLLGSDATIRVADHVAALDPRYVWVDAWALERTLAHCAPTLDAATTSIALLEDTAPVVLDLYRGPFLGSDTETHWQLPMRNRLAARFQRFVSRLGEYWESQRDWDRALALYERALELDPLAESFCRREMICLAAQGRRAEAIAAFRRCRHSLSIVLGVAPTAETDHVYRQLLAS